MMSLFVRFVFSCNLYIFRINVCVCEMSSLMNDYYGFFVFVSIDIGLVYCGAILVIRFVLFIIPVWWRCYRPT